MKTYHVESMSTKGWSKSHTAHDYPTKEDGIAALERYRIASPYVEHRLIERTTTEVEVDDGVRYAYLWEGSFGCENATLSCLCRTESEARASVPDDIRYTYRIVKITPL